MQPARAVPRVRCQFRGIWIWTRTQFSAVLITSGPGGHSLQAGARGQCVQDVSHGAVQLALIFDDRDDLGVCRLWISALVLADHFVAEQMQEIRCRRRRVDKHGRGLRHTARLELAVK